MNNSKEKEQEVKAKADVKLDSPKKQVEVRQKVKETVTKPKEISGYEKLKNLKLKRKSGIVFLDYQEDHMILEHEEKVQADVKDKDNGQGESEVKPKRKHGSAPISPKAETVRGRSTSEKKPKPSTSRPRRVNKKRGRRSKKNVISSSSDSEDETGLSSDPDECDQGPPPPKQQKRRRYRRSKILTPVTRERVEEMPTIGKMSYLEILQLSKSNVTKKSPTTPVLPSIPHLPIASSTSRKPTTTATKVRKRPVATVTKENPTVDSDYGDVMRKRRKITKPDIEVELSSLVKNMKIDTSKSHKKSVTKLKKTASLITTEVGIGIPNLSYLERNFVRKGHCFLFKNYLQGRQVATNVISKRVIKVRRPPTSAWTGFSEEKRREKQLRLHKLTGNMKNSARTIPLALTRPIEKMPFTERVYVTAGHVFLLRNVRETHRLIKSRLFWTKAAPEKGRLSQIPLKIFDPKDDKLSDYFPVPEIPEETDDSKIHALTRMSVFKGCRYPVSF